MKIFFLPLIILVLILLTSNCERKEDIVIQKPSIITKEVSDTTETSAICGGDVTSSGGAEVKARGVCWSTSPDPEITNDTTLNGSGMDTFTSYILGLTPSTKYYVKAYAMNEQGTAYGEQKEFTTLAITGNMPVAAFTVDKREITAGDQVEFTDQSYNDPHTWSWDFDTDGTEDSNEPNPKHTYQEEGVYTVTLIVWNDFGSDKLVKNSWITVNPKGEKPVAMFSASPTHITEGERVQFYDESTNDPEEWKWDFGDGNTSSERNPSHVYSVAGSYPVSLTVWNDHGSDIHTKNNYITVEELTESTVTDIEGNTYKTVKIGDQWWMAENLKTMHYADGTELIDGTGAGDITDDFTTKYWFVYDDNPANKEIYGLLYTWTAWMNGKSSSNSNPSGIQGVCPSGWHVPSSSEMTELVEFLGGESVAGGKMKEEGTSHWISPNTGASNVSGFTALPGGFRSASGSCSGLGQIGYFCNSTDFMSSAAYARRIYYNETTASYFTYSKDCALSVRCVKD